ncbi:MAG: hypothetical protein SGILL_002228 [Bacillariaceae sp.]
MNSPTYDEDDYSQSSGGDKKPAASNTETAEDDDASKEGRQEVSKAAESEPTVKPKSKEVATTLEIIPSTARTPQDVLCGRGMPFQSYPGNVNMHELVGEHRDEYMSSKRAQKPLVIKSIIQKLKDAGARFLRPHGEFRSNEDDEWVEVDDQYVYDKISHVMRHRQRAARSDVASSSPSSAKKRPSESATNAPASATSHTAANSDATHSRSLFAGAGPLHAFAAGNLGGALQHQQPTAQSLLASLTASQNQEAALRALALSTGQPPPLLTGLGLLGQPQPPPPFSSLMLGHQSLAAAQQQQQLLSLLGHSAPLPQQQPPVDQSILAQIRQNQLLQEIESQRLLAGARIQAQQQPSITDLVNEELRRRALQSLVAQTQAQQERSSAEGKGEEEKK